MNKIEHTLNHALLHRHAEKLWGNCILSEYWSKMEMLWEERRLKTHITDTSQKDILTFLKTCLFGSKTFQVSALNFHFHLNFCMTFILYLKKIKIKIRIWSRKSDKKSVFLFLCCCPSALKETDSPLQGMIFPVHLD